MRQVVAWVGLVWFLACVAWMPVALVRLHRYWAARKRDDWDDDDDA